jgi:hypothetical protein
MMKIKKKPYRAALALPVALTCSLSGTVKAQDIYVANEFNGTIGEYGLNGATVNASLISGLNDPCDIAISGNDLFVANNGAGTIGEYTLSGQTVNASLISGLSGPVGLSISGNNLFVANAATSGSDNGTIGEYGLDGSTVNASLISGLASPEGVAVSGNNLFVLNDNQANGFVGEYTTSGQTLDASLFSGFGYAGSIAVSGTNIFVAQSYLGNIEAYTLSGVSNMLFSTGSAPLGMAVSGNNIFVSDVSGDIGEYTTSGAAVNPSLLSGSERNTGIYGIAISQAPEPSTVALAGLGAAALWMCRRKQFLADR